MSNTSSLWYQLRDALQTGEFGTASALLAMHPELIGEQNSVGESVLHYLAVEDCREAVEWLYQRGAVLNSTDNYGVPLIFDVAALGYRDLALWLISQGADPRLKDAHGQTIEEYLISMDSCEMIEVLRPFITP